MTSSMTSRPVASGKFDPSSFAVDDSHAFGRERKLNILYIKERRLGSKFFLKFIVLGFEFRVEIEII